MECRVGTDSYVLQFLLSRELFSLEQDSTFDFFVRLPFPRARSASLPVRRRSMDPGTMAFLAHLDHLEEALDMVRSARLQNLGIASAVVAFNPCSVSPWFRLVFGCRASHPSTSLRTSSCRTPSCLSFRFGSFRAKKKRTCRGVRHVKRRSRGASTLQIHRMTAWTAVFTVFPRSRAVLGTS